MQAGRLDPITNLVWPVKSSCICIVSQYAPLNNEVGETLLWLLPECTVYIGRDDVTKVTDMACSTVQVGLTHFTVGCKAHEGYACSCFVLLENVGQGVCIVKSRGMLRGQFDYLRHGEYFVLGKSSAFVITIISDASLLADVRKNLQSYIGARRAKYGKDT